MSHLKLPSGDLVFVDQGDFAVLTKYKWAKDSSGYVYRHNIVEGKDHPVRLHRVVMAAPAGFDVDHINGNRLDNRKQNLRICSRRQNLWNSKVKPVNTSGFKGVDFVKSKGLFRARIRTAIGRLNLGYFKTAAAASIKYAAAAKLHHGEFARTT